MITVFICAYVHAGLTCTILFKDWEHNGLNEYLDSLVGIVFWPLLIPWLAARGDLPR